MSSPDLERGLRIKTNSLRGGLIDTVALTDIEIGEVKDAIVINFYYEEGDAGDHLPLVKNIFVHNFHVKKAQRIFEVRGLPRAPVGLVKISNVTIDQGEIGIVEGAPQLILDHVLYSGKPLEL
jgi:hypothetical protein